MKNIFKYIILPSILLIIFIVSFVKFNIEAFNYELTWGGNKGKWIYSDSGYIYPNHSINFKAGDSLRYNGVTVTSGTGGGGIAASDNISFSGRVTTSDLWTFNDSAKFTRIVNMDSLRVGTTYHSTTKTLTAANVNYNLENGFEWQNRNTYQVMTLDSANGLIIRKKFNSVNDSLTTDSKFYFNDTAKFNSRIIATDRAVFNDSLIMSSYDIFLPNGKGLNWGESVGQIYSNSGEMIGRSALFTDYTLSGNFLNSSDSASGFLVRKKLEGYADTVTSESKWVFSDFVRFTAIPTIASFYQDLGRTIQYFLPNSASDTLLTRSQTQTITNKRIDAKLNTDTNFVVETIQEMTYTVWSPADATTYYYGGIGTQGTLSTSASTWQIPIINTGTITNCYFWTRNGTGGDGDADDTLSIILRKNNTTDYYVSVGGFKTTTTGGYDKLLNTSLSIPVTSGDYLCLKVITPTWNTTNPANVSVGYRFIIVN